MGSAAATTLSIAVLGLVLSVASLTWQAATFVLSGSRVRAELRQGARNARGVISGPPRSRSLKALAEQGFTEEVIGIKVHNVGRMGASIDSVEAALAGGVKVSLLIDMVGPPLPHRLDAKSSASWFLPAAPIRQAVHASALALKRPDPCRTWLEVEVAGKPIRSKSMWLGSRPDLDR